jgi:hypothetical protein
MTVALNRTVPHLPQEMGSLAEASFFAAALLLMLPVSDITASLKSWLS